MYYKVADMKLKCGGKYWNNFPVKAKFWRETDSEIQREHKRVPTKKNTDRSRKVYNKIYSPFAPASTTIRRRFNFCRFWVLKN